MKPKISLDDDYNIVTVRSFYGNDMVETDRGLHYMVCGVDIKPIVQYHLVRH